METSQDLARLGAQMKLFKRHLAEWKTLLNTQSIVRQLVLDGVRGQSSRNERNLSIIEDRIQYMIHLNLLSKSHFTERLHMKFRHQEENIDLEKVLDDYKN